MGCDVKSRFVFLSKPIFKIGIVIAFFGRGQLLWLVKLFKIKLRWFSKDRGNFLWITDPFLRCWLIFTIATPLLSIAHFHFYDRGATFQDPGRILSFSLDPYFYSFADQYQPPFYFLLSPGPLFKNMVTFFIKNQPTPTPKSSRKSKSLPQYHFQKSC